MLSTIEANRTLYHTSKEVQQLLNKRYLDMKYRSTRRNHPFHISKGAFIDWCIYQTNFSSLWYRYRKHYRKHAYAVSIDRIDPQQPYVFNNMQMVTWKVNHTRNTLYAKNKRR